VLSALNGVVLFVFTACLAGASEIGVLLCAVSVSLVTSGNGVISFFNVVNLFLLMAFSAGVSDLVVLLTLTLSLKIPLLSRLPH